MQIIVYDPDLRELRKLKKMIKKALPDYKYEFFTSEDEMMKYTENNDVVGRINGDEFAIFAKFVNDPEELKVKVSNFLDKIVFEHCEDGKSHMVKCSAGVAISGSDVDSLEALYEKAEKNLYEAKEMGRHSFKIS